MTYIAVPAVPTETGDPDSEKVRDFLLDLGSRKEFRALAPVTKGLDVVRHAYGFGLPSGPGAPDRPALLGLLLHGAQIFVRNFSNPNTPYTRFLLNWQTGSGKTIGAITIAQEFVRQYRMRITVLPPDRPTVFVIGFTKNIIQSEMLRHPEFGFITPAEILEVERLRIIAEASGGALSPESRHYSGYVGVLKRRITDRSRGGYYKFYGYKEFANRLFAVTRRGASKGFTIASIYARGGSEILSETAEQTYLARIDAAVRAGDIEVDGEMLATLRGGLIVADEIHNTYNIQAKNNYGVAIQYALDKIEADAPNDAPRAVFMSATATGGSATEIVDLLNLLIPISQLPQKQRLRRSDFFQTAEGSDGRKIVSTLPGALARIGRLSAGRVSFLLDTDEASYPRRIFEGVPLDNPIRPGSKIAYLRFTPCPMAPFHEKTLAHMLKLKDVGKRITIPVNSYTLYDMVFPNPESPPEAPPATGDSYGLYISAETPAILSGAPEKWKTLAGVVTRPPGSDRGSAAISGPFLSLDASPAGVPGIEAYSTKYQALGKHLFEILAGGPGKIMIYHHRVRMSGVLQIREMLEVNGFLDETTIPSPSTICAVCGVPRRGHPVAAKSTWAGPHEFAPARYIIVHSDIDRGSLDRSIGRYNSRTNLEGFEYRVLIGSKIIREGFDLKAVRHQLIASLPTDIPTLIQVFGRVVRKNSHVDLPVSQRDVRIRIFVSTAGPYTRGQGPSPEVIRYAEKMESYFLTQEVEKAVRRYAVDAFANYKPTAPALDAIPYVPEAPLSDILDQSENTTTYEAYEYGDREVETIRDSINALFRVRPVWNYDDLWSGVTSGRIEGVAQSPSTFTEESFALALDGLSSHNPAVTRDVEATRTVSTISRVGEYYVRTPAGPGGQPLLDIESYVRDVVPLHSLRVRVVDYVASRRNVTFAVSLRQFETEFRASGAEIELALTKYDSEFHYTLLQTIVEGFRGSRANSPVRVSKEIQQGVGEAGTSLSKIYDLYKRFKVLVFEADLAAAPEATRLIRTARTKQQTGDDPVGFVSDTAVRLFGGGEWYDIPRKLLVGPRHIENEVVVGYAERRGSHVRFKIRPPIQELMASTIRDLRSIARGAVCETRARAEQINLASRLKAIPKTGNLEELSAADICGVIRRRLLFLEERSRTQKGGMQTGLRWFYLFNDRLPTVSLTR